MADEDAPGSGEDTTIGAHRSLGYSLRVGGGISGQVVVGNHNVLINAAEGSSLTVRSGEPPPVQPRHRPAGRPLPRRGPAPLGRGVELAQIIQAIEEGRPVQVFGVPGVGKSTLLREVAARRTADGQDVVYLSAAGLPAEDVAQELFQVCYAVDDYRPEPERLRRLMGSIRALVVVDDFEGSAEDLSRLLDTAPACDVVVASVERCLGAGGGLALPVGGLAEEPALALLTSETGRPLGDEELRSAKELWRAAQGHPLALLQAWSARGAASTAGKTTVVSADLSVLTAAITPRLNRPARQLLAVLCAMPELAVSAELLAALSGAAAAEPALAELGEARLAESGPGGYRACGELAILISQRSGIGVDAAELAGRFISWTQTRATLQTFRNAAPIVLHLLRAATASGHDAAVRDLARLTAPVLARTLRWGSWREVLTLGGQAAHRLGSAVDEAYFAHEQGIRKRTLLKGVAAGTALSGAMAAGKALAESGTSTAADSIAPTTFTVSGSAGSGATTVASSGTPLGAFSGVKALLANPAAMISVVTKPAVIAVGGAACAVVAVGAAAAIALGGPAAPLTTHGAQITASTSTSPAGQAPGQAGGVRTSGTSPAPLTSPAPPASPVPPASPAPLRNPASPTSPGLHTTLPPDTTTSTADPKPPDGDFTVSPYNGGQCYLRSGQSGYWDVDMWFSIPWTSANEKPVPANKLRLTTDVGRSKDWSFSVVPTPPGHVVLHQPGNWVDTFVDQDDSYLNRLLRVTVTVDPDNAVDETVENNNTIVLVVDLRTSLPPPDTNKNVNCYQE